MVPCIQSFVLFACTSFVIASTLGVAQPIAKAPNTVTVVDLQQAVRKSDLNFLRTEEGLETVVIVGTNDLHGAIFPIEKKTKEIDPKDEIFYKQGGMAVLGGYIKILRQQFGNRLLWLDGGDQFQGSFESNADQGKTMVSVLNALKLDAAAIGNHEFDYGQDALKHRMKEANYPYLAANVSLHGTKTLPLFPHLLQSKVLQAGPLKVGVIGLSTVETPTTTRPDFVKDLDFTDLAQATQESAKTLRDAGAQLVVLAAHVGLHCSTPKAASGLRLRRPEDVQGSCQASSEMAKLLSQLRPGTLDGVVSGHTHQVIHHFLSQGGQPIPVIQSGHEGKYLHLLYLTYDVIHHRSVPELARIEGPVPICEKVFAFQQNCDGHSLPKPGGRGPLLLPRFHGKIITPNEKITELLLPIEKRFRKTLDHVIGVAIRNIEKDSFPESAMGHLVTDAMRNASHADVAIINPGGIRAPLSQGPITFGHIYRAFPFDNKPCVATIQGSLLIQILKAAMKHSRPFSISGANITMPKSKRSPFGTKEKQDPQTDHDEFIQIKTEAGTFFNPTSKYKLAVADFIIKGGSGLGVYMKQIAPDQIVCDEKTTIRDWVIRAIQEETKRFGGVHSKEHPLIDFQKRRILIQK